MSEFKINVEIPPGMNAASVVLDEAVKEALTNSGLSVQRQAKSLVSRGVTGNLQRTITSKVTPINGNPTALVGTNEKYAPAVEFGSKPHTPPIGALQSWADQKGIPVGALWMKIRRQGTKAHPFLVPAFEEKKQAITERFKKAIQTAIERIGKE